MLAFIFPVYEVTGPKEKAYWISDRSVAEFL